MPYTTRVTLRLPNGQTRDRVLMTSELLEPGYEFELFGRQWQAIRWSSTTSSQCDYVPQRMLCQSHAISLWATSRMRTEARVISP